jgi:hypothetical protein
MAIAVTPAIPATAGTTHAPTKGDAAAAAKAMKKDRNVPVPAPVDVTEGKVPLKKVAGGTQLRSQTLASGEAADTGDVRYWLALDDTKGYYLKKFKLLGEGQHIQIWVAVDDNGDQALTYPEGTPGTCRNTVFDGGEVTVTQDQVDSFIHEFDTNMFPKESEAFSDLTSRDGSKATLTRYFDEDGNLVTLPAGNFQGPGDKVVTLVDNVRDANYYDPSTPDGQTYIAGFFSPTYASVLNRNIMTIDSFDWLHRTGANPPSDQPVADCPSAGTTARPHTYEGTFAHEYQHLLENDQDPGEVSWINEGLSDWAQTLVGYVNTNQLPTSATADRHVSCFQGFLGDNFGGAENSLTLWGDQGGPEILCDYGAAYTMMEYLHGRFGGDAFMSALHREQGNGLEGLQNVLDQFHAGVTAEQVLHQWQAMVAVDNAVDSGARLKGGSRSAYTSPTLKSLVNLASPQSYATPGAPVNGADYVQLKGSDGTALDAKSLRTLTFQGNAGYDPLPVEWQQTSDGKLYSGQGDDLDRGITRKVTVPSDPAKAVLSADLTWGTELAWDFAYVQVYDPASRTWVSLQDDQGNTTSEHDPSAAANVVANLPGLTGPSANPDGKPDTTSDQQSGTLTFDLSKYAGQTVDIAFRYITDAATVGDGFWVDDVKVGDTLVSEGTDLSAWKSLTQAHPVPVSRWTVQLVAYGGGFAYVGQVPVRYDEASDSWTASIDKEVLADRIGNKATTTTVAALVTADDPGESATSYPKYQLVANGRTQPGGS